MDNIRKVIKEFVDNNLTLPFGFLITPEEHDYMKEQGYIRYEDAIKDSADLIDERTRQILSEGNPEAYAGNSFSKEDIKEI